MKARIDSALAIICFACIYCLIALAIDSWPLHMLLTAIPDHWLWFGGICAVSAMIGGAMDGGRSISGGTSDSGPAREERQRAEHQRPPNYQVQKLTNANQWVSVYQFNNEQQATGYAASNRDSILRTGKAVRVIETNSNAVVFSY